MLADGQGYTWQGQAGNADTLASAPSGTNAGTGITIQRTIRQSEKAGWKPNSRNTLTISGVSRRTRT
jgi:hypothetical protein